MVSLTCRFIFTSLPASNVCLKNKTKLMNIYTFFILIVTTYKNSKWLHKMSLWPFGGEERTLGIPDYPVW